MNLLSEHDIALAWIGVNDPIALGGNFKDGEHVKNFAANLEAAFMAKLAGAELPEPVATVDLTSSGIGATISDYLDCGTCIYTAAQLHEAHAQGFAAGAIESLKEPPIGKDMELEG